MVGYIPGVREPVAGPAAAGPATFEAGGAGLAAVLTATIAAAPSLTLGGGPPDLATGDTAGELVFVHKRTTLPLAVGVPPAASQPAAVGTDPAILHFDVDVAALDAQTTDWRSGMGYEGVTVPATEDSPAIDIYIGSDAEVLEAQRPQPGGYAQLVDGTIVPLYTVSEPEETTVDGRPATLRMATSLTEEELADVTDLPPGARYSGLSAFTWSGDAWVLAWQPVDGLHAIVQVHGDDRAAAFAAAATLELDRAQRCAVPMRLDPVPDGAQWTECRTAVHHDPAGDVLTWSLSSLTLGLPDGDPILIYAEEAEQAVHPSDPPIEPNRTVAGYPAWWSSESPAGLLVIGFGEVSMVFIEGTNEQEATALVGVLRQVGDLDRPDTWPDRAVG